MTNTKQETTSEDLAALIVILSRYNPDAEAFLGAWVSVNKDKHPDVCSAIEDRVKLVNALPL